MKIKRISWLALAGSLLLFGLWLRRRVSSPRLGVAKTPYVLPQKDKEVLRYDTKRHTIVETTSTGTKTEYARNPTVEIRKDDTIVTDWNSWGLENAPFLGLGYSDIPRVYLGTQFFYVRQFDLGAAFGFPLRSHEKILQPLLLLGWNFYSNTSLAVGWNPVSAVLPQKPEFAVLLTIRI